MLRGEAQHDGLLFEVNRELVLHCRHYRVAQGDQFSSGCPAEVDEREGVAGGDSGSAHDEAFVKTRAVEEPGGG